MMPNNFLNSLKTNRDILCQIRYRIHLFIPFDSELAIPSSYKQTYKFLSVLLLSISNILLFKNVSQHSQVFHYIGHNIIYILYAIK